MLMDDGTIDGGVREAVKRGKCVVVQEGDFATKSIALATLAPASVPAIH